MSERTFKEDIAAIKDAVDHLKALFEESDRAAAILAVAHFDEWLKAKLIKKFVDLDENLTEKLFGPYGSLSSFEAKIDIACALKMYDEDIRVGLHTVRKIRNKFAHLSDLITFEHDKVKGLCQNLNADGLRNFDDMRDKYLNYLFYVMRVININMLPKELRKQFES